MKGTASLNEWWPKAYERLLLALRRIGCVSRSEADDILQETVVEMLERGQEFESFDKFYAFCVTRARWRALDAWRRKRKENQNQLEMYVADYEYASTEDAESTLRQSELIKAIEQLPPRSREVIALTALGKGSVEIGKELGIAPVSVRSLLRRARYQLASQYGPGKANGTGETKG